MLYLFLILCMYGYIVISLLKKDHTSVFISFTLFYVFYDWTFIQLGYSNLGGLSQVLKFLFEFIIICVAVFYKERTTKHNAPGVVPVLFVLIYGIMLGLVQSFDASTLLKSIRIFFEPILIGYILFRKGLLDNISYKKVGSFFSVLVIVLFVYSLFQYFYYRQLSDFWFYNSYDKISEKSLDYQEFNYFRDGRPRCPSFLTSAISSSIFYAYMFCYFALMGIKNLSSKILMLISLIGALLANTRIGFLIILLVYAVVLFRKRSYKFLFLIPLVAIFLTFVMMIGGYYVEESALGRVFQYQQFLSEVSLWGNGLSDPDSISLYDSFIMSLFSSVGVLSFLFFYFVLSVSKICKESEFFVDKNNIAFYVLAITLSSLYTMTFQYYAGDACYKIYFLLLFASYSYVKGYLAPQREVIF